MGNIRFAGFIISFLVIAVFLSGCTGSQNGEGGTLQFTSSPAGADVYLDQQYRGRTPCTVSEIEQGDHTLEYRLAGYDPWSAVIAVPAGQSQYYAALSPSAGAQPADSGTGTISHVTTSPSEITVQVSKDPVLVGDSVMFSGISTGITDVLLIVYGTGSYADGVILGDTKPNSAGLWTYTWSPGNRLRSGQYAVVASDIKNTTSARAGFQVIGGGEVTVSMTNHAVSAGDVLRFAGRCTTGAQSVRLVINGPGRYAGGSELGVASVLGDNTWSFKYTLDSSMLTGSYTITVYDVPKTDSDTNQFTVGYT